MPDTITAPPKAESRRSVRADQDAFAQVEKWLAVIRELAGEQAKRANSIDLVAFSSENRRPLFRKML